MHIKKNAQNNEIKILIQPLTFNNYMECIDQLTEKVAIKIKSLKKLLFTYSSGGIDDWIT